jgi:phosphohistidine phosphatase
VQWPDAKKTILVVGHQPVLGQAIAQLIGLKTTDCTIKKGAIWWLRNRELDASAPALVVTVQSPEFL